MNQIEQRRQELEKEIARREKIGGSLLPYSIGKQAGFNEALELVGREELKECNFSNNCLACKSRKYKLKQILSPQGKDEAYSERKRISADISGKQKISGTIPDVASANRDKKCKKCGCSLGLVQGICGYCIRHKKGKEKGK